MKIYVDEQKRYEDTKATGQCFTAVGAIGLIAIVLLDTGVIKLAALDSVNKLMVSIVMGLVFLIFFPNIFPYCIRVLPNEFDVQHSVLSSV